MIRVIASDLDGTLLRSDTSVSDRNIAAIERCRDAGIRFVVCTGRAPRTCKRLDARLAEYDWICYSGAEIHVEGRLIAQNPLETADSQQIVRAFREVAPDAPLHAEVGGVCCTEHPIDTIFEYRLGDLMDAVKEPVAKFHVPSKYVEDIDALNALLPKGCHLMVTCSGTLIEIQSVTATKASGLEMLLKHWGLSLAEVMSFGDDINDLEMIAECGVGVAMENAMPEVKAVAKRIAPPNDEDGVAQVLEGLLREMGITA